MQAHHDWIVMEIFEGRLFGKSERAEAGPPAIKERYLELSDFDVLGIAIHECPGYIRMQPIYN